MTTSEPEDPRRRILVVDDIELNRILTEAVLRGATYDVDSVADGAAALEAIEERPYDLVLMDLEMPGLDGHAAAAAIRRRRRDPVRLAALSSHRDERDCRRSAEVGMAAHIARPIAPQALLREIERVLHLPLPDAGEDQAADRDADRDADPWQRKSYDDWASRLGEEKMRGVLRSLDGQLRDLLRLVGAGASDPLHRLAHDVASTAGMLGFADVTRRCRAVREGEDEPHALAALGDALRAAVARLERHFAIDAPGARAA